MFSFDCYFYHPCHCPFIVLLIVGFTGAGGGMGGGGEKRTIYILMFRHAHHETKDWLSGQVSRQEELASIEVRGGGGKLFMCPYLLKVQACLP